MGALRDSGARYGKLLLIEGLVTYYLTEMLIPRIAGFMLKNNIFGYDINKKGSPMGEVKIPECVGFACAVSFIMVASVVCFLIKIWQGQNGLGEKYEEIHLSYLVTIIGTFCYYC